MIESVSSTLSTFHVRCVGDILRNATATGTSAQDLKHKLAEATCQECLPLSPVESNVLDEPTNEMKEGRLRAMLICTEESLGEFIPLAAGLIETNEFEVTIIYLSYYDVNTTTAEHSQRLQELETKIWSSLPCHHHPSHQWRNSLTILDAQIPNKLDGQEENNHQDCQTLVSLEPLHPCSSWAAERTVHLIEQQLQQDKHDDGGNTRLPHVLVSDISLVGALWVGEIWRIPTVAVAAYPFAKLAVEHDPEWSSASIAIAGGGGLWQRLVYLLRQRLYSISLTRSFMYLNKLRRRTLGLPLMKSPMDYLSPVVAVLMEFVPPGTLPEEEPVWNFADSTTTGSSPSSSEASLSPSWEQQHHHQYHHHHQHYHYQTQHWQRIHVVGALQSFCTICSSREQSRHTPAQQPHHKSTPTIMVIPPADTTPAWTRTMLQSLTLARESLAKYDACAWDALSCQNPYVDFEVIWLVLTQHGDATHHFPPIVPEFIHQETSVGVIDSLAWHPDTVIALVPCDADASVLEHVFDISVICIAQSDRMPPSTTRPSSPLNPVELRPLAAKILQHLRSRQQQYRKQTLPLGKDSVHTASTAPSNLEGLARAISIIGQAATTHREKGTWSSTEEMQQVVRQAIDEIFHKGRHTEETDEDEIMEVQPPYDTFTVFVAWFVILASVIYVIVQDFLMSTRSSSRRNHYHPHTHSGQSFSDGIFTRLTDLDDAYALFVNWYRQQPDFLNLFPEWMRSDTMNRSTSNSHDLRHPTTTTTTPITGSPTHHVVTAGGHHHTRKKKKR